EQTRMPWKNGGGETIEIARGPQGSTLDNFDWRISRARVHRSGPFSHFPDIDRTLAIIGDDGMWMKIGDAEQTFFSVDTPPVSFAGEAQVQSDVTAPITDLNVMTRRGRF